MDNLFRRLSLLCLALVLGAFARPSFAATLSDAMASCAQYNANNDYNTADYGSNYPLTCIDAGQVNSTTGHVADTRKDGAVVTYFNYTWVPPNPCAGMASANIYQQGQVFAGSQMCVPGPVQSNGSQASCGMSVSPISPPTYNNNSAQWETFVSAAPSGSICTLGSAVPAGQIVGPATVNPVTPAATVPIPLPPSVAAPPQICGGGSCFDPSSNSVCATSGGAQFCEPVNGGCGGGSGVTLCSGSPNAPAPPVASVPDPATMIQSTQQVTQADPTTGATSTSTTVVYASQSTPTASGAKAGDSTPAPASTAAGSDKGSYAGGVDCVTPPACSGDAVACGAARTQWATTCQLHTDLTGTGQPSDLAALKTKYGQGDAWATPSTGNTTGDQANAGIYDQSGFGYAQACPLHDLVVPWIGGQSFSIAFSGMCFVGGWIRGIVLAFSLFWAAIITKGGKA